MLIGLLLYKWANWDKSIRLHQQEGNQKKITESFLSFFFRFFFFSLMQTKRTCLGRCQCRRLRTVSLCKSALLGLLFFKTLIWVSKTSAILTFQRWHSRFIIIIFDSNLHQWCHFCGSKWSFDNPNLHLKAERSTGPHVIAHYALVRWTIVPNRCVVVFFNGVFLPWSQSKLASHQSGFWLFFRHVQE